MSALRKRPDGNYFVDLYVGGRRKRVSLQTKDRRLAGVRARHAERELAGHLNTTRITLADFIQEYLEYSRSRKTPESVNADRYSLAKLTEHMKVRNLQEITPRRADKFITDIAAGIKAPTLNFYLRTIKRAMNVAVQWEYLESNPFGKIQQVKHELAMPRVLSTKEIQRLMETTREMNPALVPLFEFYLLTGARRSEALKVEWKDVDFEREIMALRNTKSRRPRVIVMSPRVRSILKARRELERPFLFSPDWVSHQFYRIVRAAGIPDASLHDLRRSFSSHIQAAGMPSLFLTKLIGHTDTIVTDKHYTGFEEGMVKQYYEELERKLFRK